MKMATPQQYCLRWRYHHSNVQSMFAQLLEKEQFCDVTLYCSPSFASQVSDKGTVEPQNIKGVSLRAHRVVLAACSELLGTLLGAHETHGEPVLVIDGAEPKHMRALLDYMYTGEMNVHHSQLASLLKTAEELRIKGLTDIRWNNKDEPPDCKQGNLGITTTPAPVTKSPQQSPEIKTEKVNDKPKITEKAKPSEKSDNPELRNYLKVDECEVKQERINVNGGPPPLIKLPTKESPMKRDNSDTESVGLFTSPKRPRKSSITDTHYTDDEESRERDPEWQHGNLDISAERVDAWGAGSEGWSRDGSDDEWADAPADIGSFLHTRLRVDGDNSADEESNSSLPSASVPTSSVVAPADIKVDMLYGPMLKQTVGPKSGPSDPRFIDVVKLNDYLQHGRRPQFWEENYVKRVMEAVRLKSLEMKQAAEILGVSYGTLYGRYRDVYGCINRPYREGPSGKYLYSSSARDFWQAKGPSDVLERLQRGELALDDASAALGVSPANLAAYVAEPEQEKKFEPIPIEIDPSLKMKSRSYALQGKAARFKANQEKTPPRKVLVGSMEDDDFIPASVITTSEVTPSANTTTSAGKWPSIRVASIDTLREPADPCLLMKTRPDLTIVAAKKLASDKDDDTT